MTPNNRRGRSVTPSVVSTARDILPASGPSLAMCVGYGVLSGIFCSPLFAQPTALGGFDWDQHLFYYAGVLKNVIEYRAASVLESVVLRGQCPLAEPAGGPAQSRLSARHRPAARGRHEGQHRPSLLDRIRRDASAADARDRASPSCLASSTWRRSLRWPVGPRFIYWSGTATFSRCSICR